MPFHVLTLVSTLMAFLLGSLVNTVFKGSKAKAAEEATKESS
jgi:type II secretory pathway pseudopilin PulG